MIALKRHAERLGLFLNFFGSLFVGFAGYFGLTSRVRGADRVGRDFLECGVVGWLDATLSRIHLAVRRHLHRGPATREIREGHDENSQRRDSQDHDPER